MSRRGRLFLIALIYPLFTATLLRFPLPNLPDTLVFNITPVFFIVLVVREWTTRSEVKLSHSERRSLKYFIYSFLAIHSYYCLCAIIACSGDKYFWILSHNNLIFYYVLVTSILFIIFSSREP